MIPVGPCQCGCGEPAPIAKHTTRTAKKGQPQRFIAGHHKRNLPMLPGKYRKLGLEFKHVVIAEKALGRKLRPSEEVHHVDGNRENNAHTNLVVCPNRSYHLLLHARTRLVRIGANPNTHKICGYCHKALPFSSFSKMAGNAIRHLQSRCRECNIKYKRELRARA